MQICKDKDEAEVWFVGLKALISRGQHRKWKSDSKSDGAASSDANSPSTYTRINSPMSSAFGSTDSLQKTVGDAHQSQSPYGSPPRHGLEKAFSEGLLYTVPSKAFFQSDSVGGYLHSVSSEGRSDSINGHMRGAALDAVRVSLSSAVSSSSQGSGQDDADAMGDVFIWGEGTGDGILGGGMHTAGSDVGFRMDALLPRALESAVVLDVQNIACGGRHAALVTKQGEVFCWGEESGGRLGHGVDADASHPKLVEALANTNIELVACGEYHSCAVTLSGDLYTWGDGTHNFGLLGHGNEVSHWVPKKVNGPLEGIHVCSISCGPWHTGLLETTILEEFSISKAQIRELPCIYSTFQREVQSVQIKEEEGFDGLASMEDDGRLEIHNWGTSDQSMKDHPAVKLMSVIAERDAAILERNTALAEKKAAYAERDVALLQRDVAIADRNSALLERDAAVAALEYTKDINLNGQKSPSCGTVAGTKLFHVLAENSSLGPKEYRSIQQVSAAFPASVSEAPPAEQSKQTMRPYTANEGQKESPSNKTSDGSEPLTPKPKKPRKQDATTGEESYRQLAIVKHEWKDQDYANNKIAFDPSTMPIPVCSCTGVPQQCYRWGSGGWQSACCTTSISMYPLPMNPNKQGSRVGGRKMSGSAFGKLLGRLVAEGHDLACPIDLKNHWAKHGTNRYITIR